MVFGPSTDGLEPRGARVVCAASGVLAEGTRIAANVDVVLPLAHVYEQADSFTNLEGRVQAFEAGGIPPGAQGAFALAEWTAAVALTNELGGRLPSRLTELRAELATTSPLLKNVPRTSSARLTVL